MKTPPEDQSEGVQTSRDSYPKGSREAGAPALRSAGAGPRAALAVATAPRRNSYHWANGSMTWAEVCEAVTAPASKKECGNWWFGVLQVTDHTTHPGACPPGSLHRVNEAVVSRSAILLDADNADPTLPDVLELAYGFAAVVHSTWSHSPDAPRFRVIIPTSRELTPSEYQRVTLALIDKLGPEQFDVKASACPVQYSFKPSTSDPSEYVHRVIDGPALDVDALLSALPPESEDDAPEPGDGPTYADLSESEKQRAREYVEAIAAPWRAKFAEALDMEEGERDEEGRGWEALACDWAWACAKTTLTPWTPLNAASGRALYDEVLPPEFAGDEKCGDKWHPSLLRKAAAGPFDAPPWVAPFDALPDDPAAPATPGTLYPSPAVPIEVARQLLGEVWPIPGLAKDYTLVLWRGSWMKWRGPHWAEVDESDLYSDVTKRLEPVDFLDYSTKPPRPRRWNPTKARVLNVMSSMGAVSHVSSEVDSPSWLRDGTDAAVVSCRNGLLDLSTRELREHTPAYFNTVSVPFGYDPGAPEPKAWLAFLESLWPDDPDARALLQQWFGYVLSGRTDQQKILALIGPSRSGKGTIARVLEALIGAANSTGVTLHSLGTNFGLEPLIGKSLAVVGDGRLGGGDGAKAALSHILSISGEDKLQVDRKHKTAWLGRLPSRLMLLSNELPSFYDPSGAIAGRFLLLPMTRSFLNKEDTSLGARLCEEGELIGIFNWALAGLDDLNRRKGFTEPASATQMREQFNDLVSPVSVFVRELCDVGADQWASTQELFDAWRFWCHDSGHAVGSDGTFAKNLTAAFPELIKRRRGSPRQVWGYDGIRLRPSTTTNEGEDQ